MAPTGFDAIPFSAKDPAPLLHRHDIHLKHEDAKVAHEDFCAASVPKRSPSRMTEALYLMDFCEHCNIALSALFITGASSLLFIKFRQREQDPDICFDRCLYVKDCDGQHIADVRRACSCMPPSGKGTLTISRVVSRCAKALNHSASPIQGSTST